MTLQEMSHDYAASADAIGERIRQLHQRVLRVTLYAEKTETVFPALFFYPEDGGRR